VLGTLVDAGAFATRAVHGVDPDLGLLEVQGEMEANALGDVDWDAAVRYGQLALAHELVGASRRVLALAREHALERIQFGQPIARFQAVRHRLAEALVAIEMAASVLDAAWLDPSPATAAMAKATAGRSARTVLKHGQQVLAGIGFTTEHDLHHYVRRILVLDQLVGSSAVLTKQLGDELLATRQLPRLLPL
jgi:alkylation response protein AidB-like acyl-CoA dehydrogenase